MALKIVAVLCIVLSLIALPIDLLLIVTGLARRADPDLYPVTILVRMGWTVLLIAMSAYIFWGARQLSELRSRQHAFAAAMIATIPCISPCLLLGIPFGIWALVAMNRPEVRDAFDQP